MVSLFVKGFALVFVLTLDKQNAINFQLLGGIWILQTFPAIVFGLYTRWFHPWGLLAGWAGGMVYGTLTAYRVINPVSGTHFAGSLSVIPVIGEMGYIALTAFAANALIATLLTAILNVARVPQTPDETTMDDYFADEGDPRVEKHRERTAIVSP
jgi:SSS family solute:Na+ symporter